MNPRVLRPLLSPSRDRKVQGAQVEGGRKGAEGEMEADDMSDGRRATHAEHGGGL